MFLELGKYTFKLHELYGMLLGQDKPVLLVRIDTNSETLVVNNYVNVCGVSYIECILEDASISPIIRLNLRNSADRLLTFFYLNARIPMVNIELET